MIDSNPIQVAGRLRFFQHHWIKTFENTWVTDIISQGYTPEWQYLPPLLRIPLSRRTYSASDTSLFMTEIQKLLECGAIQEMDINEPCFTSTLFMVPKKTGDRRAVIDLRRLNRYVRFQYFKMEGLELVKSLIRRRDYMASIDLNQAFYHVPLARDQWRFFAFDFLDKRYCFKCLPFGLTTSP